MNGLYLQLQAAIGKYEEAEEVLLNVTNPEYQTEYVFTAALVRCLIMNGRATLAWDHYLRLDTGEDSLKLLKVSTLSLQYDTEMTSPYFFYYL